jgi:hypothetical protein
MRGRRFLLSNSPWHSTPGAQETLIEKALARIDPADWPSSSPVAGNERNAAYTRRAGGWYHLTSRGNERRAIDRDNRDRAHFCELLGEMVARFRVRLHGFVLMDNHDHLI